MRPAWVRRNGEWFWRVAGGVLQYLTNRMADGKASRDGTLKPMPKKASPGVPPALPSARTVSGRSRAARAAAAAAAAAAVARRAATRQVARSRSCRRAERRCSLAHQ